MTRQTKPPQSALAKSCEHFLASPEWRSSMSRPRLDAEQKKVSFSLAFSPNLIAALEKVRGAKSQSVFVEEWLRQHPQIAAELAAMNDSGFAPPVARYEQRMDYHLPSFSPRHAS